MQEIYVVRPVVCDWGVYEGDKLVIIVNRKRNAENIARILNADIKGEIFIKEEVN